LLLVITLQIVIIPVLLLPSQWGFLLRQLGDELCTQDPPAIISDRDPSAGGIYLNQYP
jgi:hypothetical protein